MFVGTDDTFAHDITLDDQTQICVFAEDVISKLNTELSRGA